MFYFNWSIGSKLQMVYEFNCGKGLIGLRFNCGKGSIGSRLQLVKTLN